MKQYRALRGIRVAGGYYATGQTVQPTLDEANFLLACTRIAELPATVQNGDDDDDDEDD